MTLSSPSSFDNFLIRGIVFTETDIIMDRKTKKNTSIKFKSAALIFTIYEPGFHVKPIHQTRFLPLKSTLLNCATPNASDFHKKIHQ